MSVQNQIKAYISGLPEFKKKEMYELHDYIQQLLPGCKLWFFDGKDEKGKVVSNPNIGYGSYEIKYADGKAKPFYQIGISANTTGISVYIMGMKDKSYLAKTFTNKTGKATVTGYCIKFKSLKDIKLEILANAIKDGIAQSSKSF